MIRTKMKTRLTLIEGKREARQLVKQVDTKEMGKRLEATARWGGTIKEETPDTRNSMLLAVMRMGMAPEDAIRFVQRAVTALAATGINQK